MDIIQIDLDSLKKEHWSAAELDNAKLVTDFVQHLMNDHDFDYIMNTFSDAAYVQHNRGIPDGLTGVVEFVKRFAKRFPEYTYDVKHMYADGDFITIHSHATMKKKDRGNDQKGFNIIDTWKIKDGKLVEHWDAVQPIDGFMRFYIWLTGGSIRNSNGVF